MRKFIDFYQVCILQNKNKPMVCLQKLKSLKSRLCHCLSESGGASFKTMRVLLLAVIYVAVHQDMENWIYNNLSAPSDYVFLLFSDAQWLGWILLVCFIIWCVYYFKKVWQDRHVSGHRFWISIWGMEVSLLTLFRWDTIKLGGVEVVVLGLIFSFLLFLFSTVKIIANFKKAGAEKTDKPNEAGFISNTTSVQKLDEVRRQYAIQLVDRLRNTRNEEEAFAVAINGSWGTGKTTFLHVMRDCLEKDKECFFEFNPWNCRSPQQIIVDFFDELQEKLKPRYSALAAPLLQYADLLSLAGAPKPVLTVFNRWFPPENTNQVKTKIHNALKNLGKPVFVLIDDLDRLDTDEIFEVLRLIRNTANFPHLFFIVAFDREYVVGQLGKKNVPAQYLDKIFMADFSLPLLGDGFFFFEQMRQELTDMGVQLDNILSHFTVGQLNLVLKALTTPRMAERFARQLAQNMKFVARDEKIWKEFSKKNLFWLELLKFTNYELFQGLYENPEKYLIASKHNQLHLWMYSLPKEPNPGQNLSELSLDILKEIMPVSQRDMKKNGLAFIENFDKYFTLGLNSRKVGFSELYNLLLNEGKNIDEQIDKWVSEKKVKSLYNQLLLRNPMQMKLEVAKSFLNILVSFSRYLSTNYVDELWGIQTYKGRFKDADCEPLSSYLKDLLRQTYSDVKEHVAVAYVIHGMLNAIVADEKEMLLSRQELEKLIKANFDDYVSQKRPDAADIFKEDSSLHKIVKASVLVYAPDQEDIPDLCEWKSFLMDEVIRYFSVHKSKNQKAAEDFCRLNISEDDPLEWIEEEEKRFEERIKDLFAERSLFERFKEQCFEVNA